MPGAIIKKGASVRYSIVAENVVVEENVTNVTQVVSNIIQEGALNLGKWRIYVNEEGNLIIDTEALAAAGKSITFKDIEI